MKKNAILPLILILTLIVPMRADSSDNGDITYTVIDGKVTVTGFSGEPEELVIPQYIENFPVTEIRDNAFCRCTTLRNITLPNTLKEIGHHAFFGCISLESITLPQQTEKLGMGCFESCTSLKEAHLSDSLIILPDSCFRSCISLKSIVISQNTTEIEKFCFCGCSSLDYVSLNGKLQTIGLGSFYMCDAMNNIYIPPFVTSIGSEALGYGKGGIKLPMKITGSGDSAAEDYASTNDIDFSDAPETAATFVPAKTNNAPVELPAALAASGGLFFILTALLALRQYLRSRK